MMIVPRQRLISWSMLAVVGLVVGGMSPSAMKGTLIAMVMGVLLVLRDAWKGREGLRGIRIFLPSVVRFSKERPGNLLLRFQNDGGVERHLRVGLPFPQEIQPLHETLVVQLPANATSTSMDWECKPLKRGAYRIEEGFFEIQSPWGFWDIRSRCPLECEIRVYPNLQEDRKSLAAIFLNRGDAGVHLRRLVGQGREFEKLREYVPGDSFDQIHWKSTAKRKKPITKVFQVEKTQEIYVVIDFSRLTGKPSHQGTILERFITAALVLGLAAEKQGDAFGCVTFSDQVRHFIRARLGKNHYSACREAIFRLHPQPVSPDFEEICIFLRTRLHQRALLFFLTDFSDPVLTENILKNVEALTRQHLVVFGVMDSPEHRPVFEETVQGSDDLLYHQLSGHLLWQQLQSISQSLFHRGVHVVPLRDEKMSSQIVTEYLAIKRRQIL